MIKESVQCVLYLCVLSLSACAVVPTNNVVGSAVNDQMDKDGVLTEVELGADPQSLVDPDLPNRELDQQTLEQLLLQHFASYNGDLSRASANSLLAAKKNGDYRIARDASLLALRNHDYEKAQQGAQLWAELKPDSVDAVNILIISKVASNDIDGALTVISKQGEDLELDEHIKKVAGLVVRQKNDVGALRVMSEFINNYPESGQALLSGAFVAQFFEKNDRAESWLNQAIELRPDWELAAQMKIDILESQDQMELRSKFVEEYAKKHPKSVRLNINYAGDLARQQRYEEALSVVESVIKFAPKDSSAINYAGALSQQLQKTKQAKTYFKKALNLDPNNDRARWALGRLAMIDGKYINAERYFNGVSPESPSFVDAQIQVANARYHIHGLRRAVDTLSLIEPAAQGEYLNVAIARHNLLLREYKYEEAFSYINEVLLFLPNNLDLLYSRALVAAELKKTAVAEADFRAILAQQPDNPDTLNALGYTLADQTERYSEAKELIAKALVFKPDAAHILDSMGWVLYRLKDYDGAIEFLRKAYDVNKGVEIAAHLGEVIWVSGDKTNATDVWQQAYDKDSDNPVLKETLESFGVKLNTQQTGK